MGGCCTDQQLYYALHIVKWSGTIFFKYFMKVVGPLLHAVALTLIFGIALVYYLFVFPSVSRGSAFSFLFHAVLSTTLLLNIFFNLVSCAFTAPGSPPAVKDPTKILGIDVNPSVGNHPATFSLKKKCLLSPGVYYKYCKKCRAVKPPRAHHCSVTGKCVYEMDHYCPWMNNCIGLYNYKFFFLFLVYLFTGCGYFMITIGSRILTISDKTERLNAFGHNYPVDIVGFAFVIALGAFISVGLLLTWHVFLVATNQTTIEFYINIENRLEARSDKSTYKNPFDQGFRLNFLRLLGNTPWYFILLPSVNIPFSPLYPLRVMSGVLTEESNIHSEEIV